MFAKSPFFVGTRATRWVDSPVVLVKCAVPAVERPMRSLGRKRHGRLSDAVGNALVLYSSEQRTAFHLIAGSPPPLDIGDEDTAQIRADRDKTALEELGLANSEHPGIAVKILNVQLQRFADLEPGSIEKQQ